MSIEGQRPGPSSVQDKTSVASAQERAAKIAVIIFPVLIVLGGITAFFVPGLFKPMTPSVPYLLGAIMFCMGLTLTKPDFLTIKAKPWAVLIGVVAHYVIMPGVAWLLTRILHLSPELAIGVILVGCAPSGTASNVMTYLAKGNVALGVAVSTVSTLIAPVVTPFLVLALAGSTIGVSAGSMMLDILKTVVIPVILGLIVKGLLSRWIHKIMGVLPWISAVCIALVASIVVAGSQSKLASAGVMVIIAVILHNGFGLALGYGAAKIAGLDARARRTFAFEVGMQNSGLASTLAIAHFTPVAALPSAVFSVWHNVSGAVLAAWMSRRPLK